ncbi:CRE-GES-1 protein, partial [Aphelenchoides avenae]
MDWRLLLLGAIACCTSATTFRAFWIMANDEPIAETSYGRLRGFFVNEDGFQGTVFLGVPFAEPPVGNLRFEKPVSPKKWLGIRNATTFADVCFPHSRPAANGPLTYSEDCLYLNVFAPRETNEVPNGFPVMVMIHGGSYESGSARRYADYRQLMRKFVSKGIVVVTIQYRLGFLGFCSTGDSVMPGNLGLWDQLAALKWVSREIHNFGGGRNRITAWGYSAGSSSVSGLTLSPHSRDLFSQAVQMSGSVFAAWTTRFMADISLDVNLLFSDKVVDTTRELAEALRCNMSSSLSIKEDLKRRSIDKFYDAVDAIGGTRYDINWVKFGPRLDGDFFTRDYAELIKEAPIKPTLLGCTEEESLLWTLVSTFNTPMFAYAVPPEKRSTFGQSDIEHFVQEAVARKENFGGKADEVQRRIVDFYCNHSAPAEKSSTFYLDRYSQICSDIQMNVPILWETRRKVAAGWPVYLYKNQYYNEALFPEDFP